MCIPPPDDAVGAGDGLDWASEDAAIIAHAVSKTATPAK